MNDSPFNPDELAAQVLAGGGPRGSGIYDFMTEQHRVFFAQLSYLFVGAVDAAGWPLATVLTVASGFAQSPDPLTLHVAALPPPGDPAKDALIPGRDVGILGIDFSTRRRNRVNGHILDREPSGKDSAAGFSVAVSQSFGNCPQYIQRRALAPLPHVEVLSNVATDTQPRLESFDHLDAAAAAVIGNADTFFVASRSRAGDGAAYGADISHRGGRPGFVRVDGDVLTIPDFRGNRYFNTLGNLIGDPRASLLFVDFDSGDVLQLQGTAQVDWHGDAARQYAGSERLWSFHVERGWRRRIALPLRWSFIDYSRTTLATGTWATKASALGPNSR